MSTCRSCGAEIIWALTDSGKRMPVDAEPVEGGNLRLIPDGDVVRVEVVMGGGAPLQHRPHFATCPEADIWRRGRENV